MEDWSCVEDGGWPCVEDGDVLRVGQDSDVLWMEEVMC